MLCNIKRDHLLYFIFTLYLKREKSQDLFRCMTDLHKIWHDDAKPVSEMTVKNFTSNLKIRDGTGAAILKIERS